MKFEKRNMQERELQDKDWNKYENGIGNIRRQNKAAIP